jgi:rubrerythrin
MPQRYQGKTVACLTQHGKVPLIAPVLEPALGCHLVQATGYDTDLFGSFTGEVPRLEGQIETARRKAQKGMELCGVTLGIASEGAFGADPFSGLMPWNIEVLIWLDAERQLEVVGIAQGPARHLQRAIQSVEELEKFSQEAGFPDHHLTLRPESPTDPRIQKGLQRWDALKQAFLDSQQKASNRLVYLEHDLRAFGNPTRQKMIQQAAVDLLKKIQSYCPRCSSSGFSITGHTPGRPCLWCGRPTRLAKTVVWSCATCGYSREDPHEAQYAKAERCDHCNP